jgi:peroxiredoxin
MGKKWTRPLLALLVCLPCFPGLPGQAAPLPSGPGITVTPQEDPQVLKLLEQLGNLGNELSKTSDPAQIAALNLQEADLLYQIAARTKPAEQPTWVKQLADCLHAAALNNPHKDKIAYDRLHRLEERVLHVVPGSDVAAYIVFRRMQLDHQVELEAQGADFNKVQSSWCQRLAQFVQSYPKCEESATALMELGMVCDSLGREAEARAWYQQLADQFPKHALTMKARGSVTRIDLQTKPFPLSLPSLLDPSESFDIQQFHGRLVVVYFWVSTESRCNSDFITLKQVLERYRKQGLAVVCVSLDKTPDDALRALSTAPPLGVQLIMEGGMGDKVMTQYGVTSVPSLFLLGKDGKVIHKGNVDIGQLEALIAEHLQK